MRSLDLPPEDVIIKCYHCGNETPMHQTGKSEWGSNEDYCFSYTYEMFTCPVCHKITLRETYGDEDMMGYNHHGEIDYWTQETILFPVSSIEGQSIPKKVKEAYEAALKIKGIDKSLCLIALRRTLEFILKDKGATKGGLKDNIEEVAKMGLLPDALKEASSLTRVLGNSAAHDENLDVEQRDVEIMAEFVEYIIEYLYVIPTKISSYKEKLSPKAED